MKKILIVSAITALTLSVSFMLPARAETLAQRLAGYVLLQVESRGEAWYVNPNDLSRYYMRGGDDAYAVMRRFGLGISDSDLTRLQTWDAAMRKRLAGRIVLQVESRGEAFYVCPRDSSVRYVSNGYTAFQILKECGLGITNKDLASIPAAQISVQGPTSPPPTPPAPVTPTGCAYQNPSCGSGYSCSNNVCLQDPAPPPVRAGSFRDASTFIFPQKTFSFGNWSATVTPDLALKDSIIKIVLTTSDFDKRGNIAVLKGDIMQLNQDPATGLGKTEEITFRNDGTNGDELANDQYFTAQISANGWYDLVALVDLSLALRDGTTETVTGLTGVTFMVFDGTAGSMAVFEADNAVAVMPSRYASAAQAFAQAVDTCHSGLLGQMGSVEYRNTKAYFQMKLGADYLETGGFVNTVTGTDAFFSSTNPANNEWSSCSPITAHELTHSIFSDVRKPVWADEGLAEFTGRAVTGATTYCEVNGWRASEGGTLRPFVSLSQSTWVSDPDHYMTALCAYRYIQDNYGQQAIRKIYDALKSRRSFAISSYCGANYDFYRDVIFSTTDLAMRDILKIRFGIPESELSCASL